MTVILILIYFTESFRALILVLISDRECTLVQGKCDKMVTSAMPPSHDLKGENSKNSIFFSFTAEVQTM